MFAVPSSATHGRTQSIIFGPFSETNWRCWYINPIPSIIIFLTKFFLKKESLSEQTF